MSRLWQYNLHYFDDLNAVDASNRTDFHGQLIQRWIDENPAPNGTGWEPYPCSLRIVNWIKWAVAGNELSPAWQQSLAIQANWVSRNIEWHLLGNHVFANAKALVFAGLFFEGAESDFWLRKGLKILAREIPEQVMADGGQFERSPMYHAIALEDMLDLINAGEAWSGSISRQTIDEWRYVARSMLLWMQAMQHPDGKIALFNDCAFGVAPELAQISEYAARLGIGVETLRGGLRFLEDSGYARASNDAAVLIADVGEIGPDYLPAHAHADTLSFELSLFGRRWFVDTGCSTYEVSAERLRQRGTAAHNTVIVDGQNSSEVWSSFRVARRAKPCKVSAAANVDKLSISGGHDGYQRLRGRVTHNRSFELSASRLQVTDWLDGQFQRAEANFLLHPEIEISNSDTQLLLRRGGRSARLAFSGGNAEIQDATWHPEFGLSIATHRINVKILSERLVTDLTWIVD